MSQLPGRFPAWSSDMRSTLSRPRVSGLSSTSGGWPAGGCAANSRFRGKVLRENPTGPVPSRPAWGDRWRRRCRASTARGTRLLACAWERWREGQPRESLRLAVVFPSAPARRACWYRQQRPGTCARAPVALEPRRAAPSLWDRPRPRPGPRWISGLRSSNHINNSGERIIDFRKRPTDLIEIRP